MEISDRIESETEEFSTCPYPWRRFFARMLDLSLYGLIWHAFTALVLNWNIQNNFFMSLVNSFVMVGIMLLVEPLLLSKFGATLGKFVFGLIVRDLDGRRLTYKQGWVRTFGVFRKGMGYNIPLYDLLIMANCYDECKTQKWLTWEKNSLCTIKDKKFKRILVGIVIFILICGMNALVIFQADMPLHKGDITPEEYYENCNDIMSQSNEDYGRHLNEKGKWIQNAKKSDDFLAEVPLPNYQLTVKDGIVTGVRIELETDNDVRTFGFLKQKEVSVKSFFAAQKKMDYFQLKKSGVLNNISNRFENYTFTQDGFKFTNQVELKGYEIKDDWIEHTGHDYYIHMVFTVEKF
ncbi:RDD family protein [Aminipila sp.]|uniref:RDD family protein n=1 Tax=Aminipila sp. TaxID=2060095 RepID=UPI00289CBD3A|nr:RDD family protein [Aminipila sp.]